MSIKQKPVSAYKRRIIYGFQITTNGGKKITQK